MDVSMSMADEGKRIYEMEALKETALALLPVGKLLSSVKWLGRVGWLTGRVVKEGLKPWV